MNKEEIIEKLKTLGITTDNCYPKTSFVKNDDIYIGCYGRELKDDFYFYNTFDKKVYVIKKGTDTELASWEREMFNGKEKVLVPLKSAKTVWEDKPYEALADVRFAEMSLREYACIHLGVPETDKPWLNELIKKGRSITNWQ